MKHFRREYELHMQGKGCPYPSRTDTIHADHLS
jgi:hypothetical protein